MGLVTSARLCLTSSSYGTVNTWFLGDCEYVRLEVHSQPHSARDCSFHTTCQSDISRRRGTFSSICTASLVTCAMATATSTARPRSTTSPCATRRTAKTFSAAPACTSRSPNPKSWCQSGASLVVAHANRPCVQVEPGGSVLCAEILPELF